MNRCIALIALFVHLCACGGENRPPVGPEPTVLAEEETCDEATATDIDFRTEAEKDVSEALADEDSGKVDNIALGLGLGSEIAYVNWAASGDLLVAVNGCEEGECSAGVVLIERNQDGFFVKRHDTSLPSVLDADVFPEWVFVGNLIGDDKPEFWVVYTTHGKNGESERNAAVYSANGLSLLWSKTLGKAEDECATSVKRVDLECDGFGDLLVERACANESVQTSQYTWHGTRLRSLQ